MDTIASRLTVFFEDPFWVGVYERQTGRSYEACKITFGTEPRDYEVYGFLLENWNRLRFSPPVGQRKLARTLSNPKRMQREAKRQIKGTGVGTKAQQALQLEREQGKLERKADSRERREAEKERLFELRQAKRKEKHKGH